MHNARLTRSLRFAACSVALLAWGPSAAASQQTRHTLGLPGSGWGVILDIPGFELINEQIRSDGGGRMMEAVDAKKGMMLSLFVEREPELNGTQACRDFYWEKTRRSPLPKRNVRSTEQPPLSVMHYLVPSFQGQRLMQQNANAYYGRDGICVDLHLSKVGYVPADSVLFDTVLRSVRIGEGEDLAGTEIADSALAEAVLRSVRAAEGEAPPEEGGAEVDADGLAEIEEAERFARTVVTSLLRDGVAGMRSLLTPEAAREKELAGRVARIRSVLPGDAAEALELVETERYQIEGVEYAKLSLGRRDSPSRTRVELWLKQSGGERRVRGIRVTTPSADPVITFGTDGGFDP